LRADVQIFLFKRKHLSIQKKTSAGSIFTMKQTKDCLINAIKKRISFDEYNNEEQEKIQRLKLNCNVFATICAPHHLHSRICPNKHQVKNKYC
jgi:hypothetical protein